VLLNYGDARYTYDNSYFGMAVLDLEKETDAGTKWKLTLAPERGTGALFNGARSCTRPRCRCRWATCRPGCGWARSPTGRATNTRMPKDNKLITHNLLFDTMAPTAYTGAVLDLKRGKWWTRIGLANVNTARRTPGHKTAGADLPRRLLQGRVRGLRLHRPARQGRQLRRRRHLDARHRHGRRRRQPDPRGNRVRRRRQGHADAPAGVRRLLRAR
jgi:hypothetical protein